MTREAVIVNAVRTPIGKARRGGLATVRPDEMAALVIKELLKRTPQLDPEEVAQLLKQAKIAPQRRPETLSLEEWARLQQTFANKS